ncbi:MAG: glycosyltransferase, partial [Planctomycetota bacterium]
MDFQSFILPPYAAAMSLLGLYGLHRLLMLRRFDSEALTPRPVQDAKDTEEELPFVTIQLPIYNEATVAGRLLRAAGEMRYPKDRFEIQVLDDSTDNTREIVDAEAAALRERGIAISVVRRDDRSGFKAGALNAGMQDAKGNLLAIFDADFVPDPGFLEELVPTFADDSVGMVQARWGHENRDDSWLTRAQATLLDGHFVIEHQARHGRGLFFNFNGTAGIWRRAAIDDAGGWQHDTLTEDLDLSYRAQLDGWKFVYVPRVVAPAEVPPEISAFKSQQHRWAKGSVQVFRKLGLRILRSEVPWRVKVEALFHLTGNIGYPCVLILAVLLPLSIQINERVAPWVHAAMFILCTISVVLFYERSQRAIARPLRKR